MGLYHKITCKQQWLPKWSTGTVNKQDLHSCKLMLSVWLDIRGIIYF